MGTDLSPRLRWACRRGMLELDILLGQFLEEAYPRLSEGEKALFVKLLDCSDQDLFLWLTAKAEPEEAELKIIVNQVRHHAQTRS